MSASHLWVPPRVGVGPGSPFCTGMSGHGFPLLKLGSEGPGLHRGTVSSHRSWLRLPSHEATVLGTLPHSLHVSQLAEWFSQPWVKSLWKWVCSQGMAIQGHLPSLPWDLMASGHLQAPSRFWAGQVLATNLRSWTGGR